MLLVRRMFLRVPPDRWDFFLAPQILFVTLMAFIGISFMSHSAAHAKGDAADHGPAESPQDGPRDRRLPLFNPTTFANGDPAPLQLEIRADFSRIFGRQYGYGTDKRARVRVAAEIRLTGDERKSFTPLQSAEISGRGALRGNQCPFSPLKIEFKGRPKEPSYFQGVDEIKVVTHCGKDVLGRSESLRSQLLNEFTIYRLYELVAAPVSFQARLARIRYIDTSGTHQEVTEFAIFVEDISDLTRRLGAQRLFSQKDARLSSFDPNYLAENHSHFNPARWVEMLFFQGLIRNHDFEWGHNLKGIVGSSGWEPIPYDFDYADLFYRRSLALPNDLWSFQPYDCLSRGQAQAIIKKYKSASEKMIGLVKKTKLVEGKSRDIAIQNIEFFVKHVDQIPLPVSDLKTCP